MFPFSRAARLACLPALSLVMALLAFPGHAAQVDYFLEIDGLRGEFHSMPAAGFDVQILGSGPQASLLLPAVQKVREAASRSSIADMACEGAILPRMTIEVSEPGRHPYLRYELMNVVISGYGMGGSSESRPMESLSLNFTEIKVTYVETGAARTWACTPDGCTCMP